MKRGGGLARLNSSKLRQQTYYYVLQASSVVERYYSIISIYISIRIIRDTFQAYTSLIIIYIQFKKRI